MACTSPSYWTSHGRGPCGICDACLNTYINSWVLRLLLESNSYPEGYTSFLTLTYEDSFLPSSVKAAKRSLQLFLKRLRRKGPKLRYYASLEYGDLHDRLHWHLILFGISSTSEAESLCVATWSNGFIKLRPASVKAMRYVLKYVLKSKRHSRMKLGVFAQDGRLRGCWLMSRNPGLGSAICDRLVAAWAKRALIYIQPVLGYRSSMASSLLIVQPPSCLRYAGLLYPVDRYLKSRFLSFQGLDLRPLPQVRQMVVAQLRLSRYESEDPFTSVAAVSKAAHAAYSKESRRSSSHRGAFGSSAAGTAAIAADSSSSSCRGKGSSDYRAFGVLGSLGFFSVSDDFVWYSALSQDGASGDKVPF